MEARIEAFAVRIGAMACDYLPRQRWFIDKSRSIARVELRDYLVLPTASATGVLGLVDVRFADGGEAAGYFLPLLVDDEPPAEGRLGGLDLRCRPVEVHDALDDAEFCRTILSKLEQGVVVRGKTGVFRFVRVAEAWPAETSPPCPLRAEQSNTSVRYGNDLILKAFRRLAPGVNPEREMGQFLTRRGFANAPSVAGYVEYLADDGRHADLAILQRYVPNEGDAWSGTVRELRALCQAASGVSVPEPAAIESAVRRGGAQTLDAGALGRLTGRLHNALSADASDPDFAPERVTPLDLERWIERACERVSTTVRQLAERPERYGPAIGEQIARVAAAEGQFRRAIEGLAEFGLAGVDKIRIHGDYHLGQVILAGGNFVILDFEGEPLSTLPERRAKQPAAKDVAGMLRSFHYAATAALPRCDAALADRSRPWIAAWLRRTRQAFLDGYFDECAASSFWPSDRGRAERLVAVFELHKACYELAYEAASRPDWLAVPLSYLDEFAG